MPTKCSSCSNYSLYKIGDKEEATCVIHGGKIAVDSLVDGCIAYELPVVLCNSCVSYNVEGDRSWCKVIDRPVNWCSQSCSGYRRRDSGEHNKWAAYD